MASKTSKGGTVGSQRPKGSSKAHRAYQPVNPCGNKLLQQRWDQKYYDDHRKLVRAAKPMVDTSAPTQRPHITSKLKKQQLAKERAEVIDRDNHTLLVKMQHIMNTEGKVDHKSTYKHHSLNESQRQREVERVAEENKKMLARLQKVEPKYKVTDWIDDWRRKEELTGMITAYPEELERPMSKTAPSRQHSTQPTNDTKLSKTTTTATTTPAKSPTTTKSNKPATIEEDSKREKKEEESKETEDSDKNEKTEMGESKTESEQ